MMWWQTSTGAVGKDTALSHQSVCIGTRSSCRGARSLAISERGQRGAMVSSPLASLLYWRDTRPWSFTADLLLSGLATIAFSEHSVANQIHVELELIEHRV